MIGQAADADLPQTIRESNYYANLVKRALAGDASRKTLANLESYLRDAPGGVWENSWIRFPIAKLNSFAERTLRADLAADKSDPLSPARADRHDFLFRYRGEDALRIPISYAIKLALAHCVGEMPDWNAPARRVGERLLNHFLSDNTSPETHSFHISRLAPESGMGKAVARETAKRFLFTHLLAQYANAAFGLRALGQRATVFFSPSPPLRQKQLNESISDAFYRDLFMSPCLSGWDRGEAKREYMGLCHRALSWSQLCAMAKLRDCGIIANNLVVMPALSNISLANNGVHVSLGSRMLSQMAADPRSSGFDAAAEKHFGDLTIKIAEHFLPLFVGTYSAAPSRIDFQDFHPERILGFLPHELDFTHLRMLWRRWKAKASLRVLGRPTAPFGPPWLDRAFAAVFRARGDFVPDMRLLDYLVAPLSTNQSPALNGVLGNLDQLKRDLAGMGVIHENMAFYMLMRQRVFGAIGYAGFEARYYSLFEHFDRDMARAVDLQTLVTALAAQYAARGDVRHADIPDEPHIESERRQPFFCAAIGIETFNVGAHTGNRFLRRVLARTDGVRKSRRYRKQWTVSLHEYRLGLLRTLREDGAALIDAYGMDKTLRDLEKRLKNQDARAAWARLTRGILDEAGGGNPMRMSGEAFARAAETHYRDTLRKRHLSEAFLFLEKDLKRMESAGAKPLRRLRCRIRFWRGTGPPGLHELRLLLWQAHRRLSCLDAARVAQDRLRFSRFDEKSQLRKRIRRRSADPDSSHDIAGLRGRWSDFAAPFSGRAIRRRIAGGDHGDAALALQGLWIGVFLYTGRSSVTASRLSFHLLPHRH